MGVLLVIELGERHLQTQNVPLVFTAAGLNHMYDGIVISKALGKIILG